MPISKYLCRLSKGIPQRGLRGMQKMSKSVKTLMLDIAVPIYGSVRLLSTEWAAYSWRWHLQTGNVGMQTVAIPGTSPVIGTQLKEYSIACTNIHTKQNMAKPKQILLITRSGKRR